MRPRQQRVDHIEVLAQFIRSPRLARIISSRRDAACQIAARILESTNIISLPAVQTNGNILNSRECLLRVHTHCGVAFLRNLVGMLDMSVRIDHGCLWKIVCSTSNVLQISWISSTLSPSPSSPVERL